MISRRTLSQLELGSVVSLLVVAGGLFAFISIADEVREGETHGFDSAILLASTRPPGATTRSRTSRSSSTPPTPASSPARRPGRSSSPRSTGTATASPTW